MSKNTEVLIDGLTFTEGPRWHEGKLYYRGKVLIDSLEDNQA